MIMTIARRFRTPLLFALVLILLTAALLILSVRPAFADSYLCRGTSDSSCTDAGYTDHGYAAHMGTMYWSEYAGVNCTNYVAYVESTVNGVATPSPHHLGN